MRRATKLLLGIALALSTILALRAALGPGRPQVVPRPEPAAGAPTRTGVSEPAAEAPEEAPSRRVAAAADELALAKPGSAASRRIEGVVRIPPGTPEDERAEVLAIFRRNPEPVRAAVAPDGAFALELPAGSELVELGLEARYLLLPEALPAEQIRRGERLVLEPTLGGLVRGRVEPTPADPAVRLVVTLDASFVEPPERSRLPFDRRESFWSRHGTRVDADGTFELRAVAPGAEHDLWITADDLPRGRLTAITVHPGEVTELVVPLATASVRGRVIDPSGRGVEGVKLGLLPAQRRGERWSGTSGEDGAFDFQELPACEYTLEVEPEGYARTRTAWPALEPGEQRVDVAVELAPGGALAGVVLLPGGTPAAGARVALRQEDGPDGEGARPRPVETGADGRFRFVGLTRAPCTVSAALEDLPQPEADVPQPQGRLYVELQLSSPGLGEHRLALGHGEILRGRAVDERGQPVRSFTVRARRELRGSERFASRDIDGRFRTDDGRFELVGLSPGEWNVELRAFHHRDWRTRLRLPTGAPLVATLERFGRVSGRVRMPSGAPAARARIFAEPEGAGGRKVDISDDAGRFRGLEVAAGRYLVTAELDGHSPSEPLEVLVAAGSELAGLELLLRPGARLTVHLRAENGKPVANRAVSISLRGSRLERATDALGAALFDGLEPGRYQISARGPEWRSRTVDLKAGEHARVEL